MNLKDISIESFLSEEENAYGRFAAQGVARGMEPWTPDHVTLYVEFDIDYNRYRLVGEAIGKNWRFDFPMHLSRDDMLDPLVWAEKTYYGMLRAFRNRESDPVPGNIKLGEN